MAIRSKIYNQANSLLKAIEISNQIFTKSKNVDNQKKIAFEALNNYSKTYLENAIKNDKLTAHEVKSLESEFFKYWNESINQEVEFFWKEINKNQLPYQRKSPIKELLTKGKFRQVEQWIDLFNSLDELKKNKLLIKEFTRIEIEKFYKLVEAEEEKRFKLVNRCYQKKKIPFSQYLKFGESMAFLERCNLTKKYFTEKEREEIYEIWKSTK